MGLLKKKVRKFNWNRIGGTRVKYCPSLKYTGFNFVKETRLQLLERHEELYESLGSKLDFLDTSTLFTGVLHNCATTLISNYVKNWKRVEIGEALFLTKWAGVAVWASDDYNDVGYDPNIHLMPQGRRDYLLPLTLDRLNRLTPKGRREFLDKLQRDTLFEYMYEGLLGITPDEYYNLKYSDGDSPVNLDVWNEPSIRRAIMSAKKSRVISRLIGNEIKSLNKLVPFASPSEAIKED